LATIPSGGSAELSKDNSRTDCQKPNISQNSNSRSVTAEDQKEHSGANAGLQSVVAIPSSQPVEPNATTRESPSIERLVEIPAVGPVLDQKSNGSPNSTNTFQNSQNFLRQSTVPPTTFTTSSDVIEISNTLGSGSSAGVDSGVSSLFIEYARSLTEDTPNPQNKEVSSRNGENDERNVPVDFPTVGSEKQEKLEALNPGGVARKRKNDEKEELRRIKRHSGELDDSTLLEAATRQKAVILTKFTSVEESRTERDQSRESADQKPGVSLSQSEKLEIGFGLENKPKLDIQSLLEDQLSSFEIANGSKTDTPKSHKVLLGERQTDVVHPDPALEHDDSGQVMFDQSSVSPERSVSTVHDPSIATERAAAHGEITSYGVERFLGSSQNDSRRKRTLPEALDASASSPDTDFHSERPRKRSGKAPKIRSAKLDASRNVDLSPAPGADKYWTYDEKSKAYYHIDSDTGSTFWYEDSSDDSEE
jgi:hypothetical protein